MSKVYLFCADGFEEVEGLTAVDLLRRAGCEVKLVSIMGRNGIPCIGFGPGAEAQAHAPNEKTWKIDLVRCAAVYAALPTIYCENK